jgi:hypothetical protein
MKSTGSWAVAIQTNKERKYLGVFTNIVDAIKIRDSSVKELHGEYARLK